MARPDQMPMTARALGLRALADSPIGGLPAVLTQREAADLLRVSTSYLRASSCPKHLLPGNGPRGRALVRYLRDEVLSWARPAQSRNISGVPPKWSIAEAAARPTT